MRTIPTNRNRLRMANLLAVVIIYPMVQYLRMIILGIDPGTATMGYGVLEKVWQSLSGAGLRRAGDPRSLGLPERLCACTRNYPEADSALPTRCGGYGTACCSAPTGARRCRWRGRRALLCWRLRRRARKHGTNTRPSGEASRNGLRRCGQSAGSAHGAELLGLDSIPHLG